MATSAEELCNLALSNVGSSFEIAILTEKSQEANACRRFYETARDKALRDYPWPFANTNVNLALVANQPTIEWLYSYRYPTDCVYFKKILSQFGFGVLNQVADTRRDNVNTKVPYVFAQDSQGQLIYTDQANAIAEYTSRITDPTRYPADFTLALSYLLAVYIAPRVSKGDPSAMLKENQMRYQQSILEAYRSSGNEESPDRVAEAEWIRARNGTGGTDWHGN